MPPPRPENNGSYPEDQECEDGEKYIDSSLSIDEVVAWIANGTPGAELDNWDDGDDEDDEGIDGFGHDDHSRPARVLEPFCARFATSSWTRWDSTT